MHSLVHQLLSCKVFMRKTISILITLFFAFSLAPLSYAGEEGLEDDTLAKIARAKAKKRGEYQRDKSSERDGGGGGGGFGKCGSLNIGNVVAPKRGATPREVTVVVTGDVINANNKCKN